MAVSPIAVLSPIENVITIETMQQMLYEYDKERCKMQQQLDIYDKERNEMKADIAILMKSFVQFQHHKSRDKRKHIKKDVRQQVVFKQGNLCGECKLALTPYFQIDHVIGLQFGGTDDESNLMALCCECHAKKSEAENRCRKRIKAAIQSILKEPRNTEQEGSVLRT
jgi:5-methylcytosine-specific restriction endonuclease McrA